jgi:GH24 family phage-related lysozyme (muramidase)
MLRTTRRALETLLGQLDAAERQLLAQSRAVPAAAVARLEQEAVNSAGRFVQGARAQRDALAKYLAALADRLDREAAAEADARERAKCPFTHRFGGSLERVIAENEGRRARSYDDANKIRTIGVGFNMERADSPAIVAKVLTAHPGTFSAADINSGQAFQDLFHQRAVLDEAQISALFRYTFAEARRIVTDRGVKNFDSLPAPVQAALVDTAFQRPANINRIAADINQGDYVAAADYLERWGAQIAAKDPQGLGGVKGRTERNGAMLRNLC